MISLPILGFILAWVGLICWILVILGHSTHRHPSLRLETILLQGGFLFVVVGMILLFGGNEIALLFQSWSSRGSSSLF